MHLDEICRDIGYSFIAAATLILIAAADFYVFIVWLALVWRTKALCSCEPTIWVLSAIGIAWLRVGMRM